jgi:hypothetical protein
LRKKSGCHFRVALWHLSSQRKSPWVVLVQSCMPLSACLQIKVSNMLTAWAGKAPSHCDDPSRRQRQLCSSNNTRKSICCLQQEDQVDWSTSKSQALGKSQTPGKSQTRPCPHHCKSVPSPQPIGLQVPSRCHQLTTLTHCRPTAAPPRTQEAGWKGAASWAETCIQQLLPPVTVSITSVRCMRYASVRCLHLTHNACTQQSAQSHTLSGPDTTPTRRSKKNIEGRLSLLNETPDQAKSSRPDYHWKW